MTKMEAANKIVLHNGECLGVSCVDCPADGEEGCSILWNDTADASDAKYFIAKTTWFKNWICKQGGYMDKTALDRIEALEAEVARLKGKEGDSDSGVIYNDHKSYVGVAESGDAYLLIGYGNGTIPFKEAFAWHDLAYSKALTWDGIHPSGQEAIDAVVNMDDMTPWTIHEFSSGASALAYMLSTME